MTDLMATAANKLQTGGLSYGRFAHWQMSLHLNKALLVAAEADQSLGLVGAELGRLVSKPSVQMSLMACLLHPATVLASRCCQSLCSAIRQSPCLPVQGQQAELLSASKHQPARPQTLIDVCRQHLSILAGLMPYQRAKQVPLNQKLSAARVSTDKESFMEVTIAVHYHKHGFLLKVTCYT